MSDDLHTEWARLFLRSLAQAGARHVVASPGSRSTPLVLAACREASLETTLAADERSAAFFALSQARVTGRPSVLICTSGTAAAHYLPALIEAERAQVPLVALTADRPWELTDAHANQTIDQAKLYGGHVRASLELGLPEPGALGHVPSIAARAVLAALSPVPGPVHVNARFRKPLEPVRASGDEPWRARLASVRERGAPRLHLPRHTPSEAAVERLLALVVGARRGLLVAGPLVGCTEPRSRAAERLRAALGGFARRSGFVVAAEAGSGVLHGPDAVALPLGALGAWLASWPDGDTAPDVIIELGLPPTTGAWETALERLSDVPRALVTAHGLPDPSGTASDVVIADAATLFECLADRLATRGGDSARLDSEWRERLQRVAAAASVVPPRPALSEPEVARSLVAALPARATLMLGNSQPVRDVDRFGGRVRAELTVLHQRGVSGIDGLIAGAAGARSVTPASEPVVALLGDVSALHDIGSLALAAEANAPLVLVVVNNGGGRIFELLPVARAVEPALLEQAFLTPPRLSLQGAAQAFGVAHERVERRDEWSAALGRALVAPQATLLEVVPEADATRAARAVGGRA